VRSLLPNFGAYGEDRAARAGALGGLTNSPPKLVSGRTCAALPAVLAPGQDQYRSAFICVCDTNRGARCVASIFFSELAANPCPEASSRHACSIAVGNTETIRTATASSTYPIVLLAIPDSVLSAPDFETDLTAK
jgi:hypothetical protein